MPEKIIIPGDKMILIQEEPRGPSMLIETTIDSATSQETMELIQELVSDTKYNIVIKSLRLVTFAELAVGTTTGLPNAPLAELQKMTLLLYAEGWIKGQYIPLLALNNTFIEGSGIPYRDKTTKLANWNNVDWNKTKIQYSNTTQAVGFPYVVIFEVEYERFDIENKVVYGPRI